MTKNTSAQSAFNLDFEEKSILAGILSGDNNIYAECMDILSEDVFNSFTHKIVYGACSNLFKNGQKISLVNAISESKNLGLDDKDVFDSILKEQPASIDDIRNLSKRLKNRAILKEAVNLHRKSIDDLLQLSATEDIQKIFSITESALFDLVNKYSSVTDSIIHLKDVARDLVDYFQENPSENVGLPTPWPKFNQSIGGGMRTGVTLIGARSGVGKAQPLYSKVLTVDGFKRMGDIKVGDKLIDPQNKIVDVTHIHPHPNKEVYRIYFNRDIYVDACEDHIWLVEKNRSDYQNYEQLKTTKELYDNVMFSCVREGRKRWKVHTVDPIDFGKSYTYVIPPYSLGSLIGDGCIAHDAFNITSADPELLSFISKELPDNLQIKPITSSKYGYGISRKIRRGPNTWKEEIARLNLNKTSHYKYIPDSYKYGSIETRKELLRGLFDTDGSPRKHLVEYSTTSIELARDICFIVRSLGGLACYKARYTKCNDKKFLSYRLLIRFNDSADYFKLSRKKDLAIKKSKYYNFHYISKIEKIGKKDCQCITVSSKEGMYITDNFVKTHNSFVGSITSAFLSQANIPVLFLDTEMEYKDVIPRIISNMSCVEIKKIENGSFGSNSFSKKSVYDAVSKLESCPFYYKTIAGKSFDEILSIIRRWVYKDVGIRSDGKANECLIIYDYFKIMDSGDINDMTEYQAMGFQISKLTDFCKAYDLPCLSFVQLNRDGVSKEGTDVIAQSDRLLWLCNSFSIFKVKTADEIDKDGANNGNRKMVTLKSRYGGEHSYGEYISMQFNGSTASLLEVTTTNNN